MKVALVTEPSGGGSGRHVLDLGRGLADRGHEVSVHYSPLRAEPGFVDDLRSSGLSAHATPMRRSVGLHDLADGFALWRSLWATGPFDVMHAHSSKAGALVRLSPPWLPGARIYTPHAFRTLDPSLGQASAALFGGLERALGGMADKIVVVSAAEAIHARTLGLAGERLATVPNGVTVRHASPDERAAARERLGVVGEAPLLGFLGRLSPQKDPLRFVQLFASLAERHATARAVIAGDGKLQATVREHVDAAGLTDRVVLTGWADPGAIWPALDLFVMTSRYEAMPYTLLEALAHGVPILTTDVGGTAEAVAPGVTGEVVPVDTSAEKMAEKALRMLAQTDELAARRVASFERAQAFSSEAMVEATLRAYEDALLARRKVGLPTRPGSLAKEAG